jgi:hypothetical protein
LARQYSKLPGTFSVTDNGLIEYRNADGSLQTRRAIHEMDRKRMANWLRFGGGTAG